MFSALPHGKADPSAWARTATIVYQPIVSTASLQAHGFEALARLPADCPFAGIADLLDAAHEDGCLAGVQRRLGSRSLRGFALYPRALDARMFCNVDNRLADSPVASPDPALVLIAELGLKPANLCLELSVRTAPGSTAALSRRIDRYLRENIRIAIDEFGRSSSGLEMLMLTSPHYIKIDRLFIHGIAHSPRQQAIVAKVIGLGHSLGLLTIAKGVEDMPDFRLLREMGCDFVQGFLIGEPVPVEALKPDYSGCCLHEVRSVEIHPRVQDLMVRTAPLSLSDPVSTAVARFRNRSEIGFLPVVDDSGYVHGAVFEEDLYPYLFSEYGAALLANSGLNKRLDGLVRRCPISEATASPEAIVESYLVSSTDKGIVLTSDGLLVGMLSSQSVLKLSAERALEDARDRNPLTALPGNRSLGRHVDQILQTTGARTLVFFDFDNFKCFNDVYGFAAGDGVISEFADLLLAARHSHGAFVAHVGGDDFFASLRADAGETGRWVAYLQEAFRTGAAAHYTPEHRAAGGIWTNDRFGQRRFFPLLRASAVMLEMPADRSHLSRKAVLAALSSGKSAAKAAPDAMVAVTLPEPAGADTPANL